GNLEYHVEHTFLCLVQVEQPAEQERSHFGHGCTNRMSIFTEYIPENDRRGFALEIGKAEFFRPAHDLGIVAPRLTQPGEVAFDIGHKYRNIPCAEIFRKRLERYRFARSGR